MQTSSITEVDDKALQKNDNKPVKILATDRFETIGCILRIVHDTEPIEIDLYGGISKH